MKRTDPQTLSPAIRGGFTLIEVMVVVAIVALLAGLVMPRLTGQSRRAALAAADDAADLLTLFAHRDSLGQANVAVSYHHASNTLMLLELVGDPARPDEPMRWDTDRFVSAVRLPGDVEVIDVHEDGFRVDEKDWTIPIIPAQGRPSIELTLSSPDVEVTLVLPSYAMAATVLRPGDRMDETRRVIDLDQAGRDKEIW